MRNKIIRYLLFAIVTIILFSISFFNFTPFLNENQILYLSSTLAQVAATLFGLSITGYIFLEDKLAKDIEKDDTLVDVIEKLKDSYRHILLFGSWVTGLSILFCVINILYAQNAISDVSNYFIRYIIRCSIIFASASIFSTLRFVYRTVDPHKLRKISQKGIKESKFSSRINKKKDTNYLDEFLLIYNQLERDINEFISSKFDLDGLERRTSYKNFHLLLIHGIINDNQYQMLQELRKFRNYTVHGDTMFVNESTVKSLKSLQKDITDCLNMHLEIN